MPWNPMRVEQRIGHRGGVPGCSPGQDLGVTSPGREGIQKIARELGVGVSVVQRVVAR
jgi:hypothetical protein